MRERDRARGSGADEQLDGRPRHGPSAAAKLIAASVADAVFVGAAPDTGFEAPWQELFAKLPV